MSEADWKIIKKLLERLERFTDGFERGEEGHRLNRQIQTVLITLGTLGETPEQIKAEKP